ncbi:MAG: hypothetical protein SGI92_30315 [Bryobacteraceae bacterium]|nr:hypothetical protein [Bryobacteraceae bacterium]
MTTIETNDTKTPTTKNTAKPKLTPAQRAEISRCNGAKSKGPVTPEGKARSAQNATTHGIYTRSLVLGIESDELFLRLTDAYLQQFQPAGAHELDLVMDIVNCRWRMSRIICMETAAVDLEFERVTEDIRVSLAFTGLDGTGTRSGFALLGRSEARLARLIHRATAELARVQKARHNQHHHTRPDGNSGAEPQPAAAATPPISSTRESSGSTNSSPAEPRQPASQTSPTRTPAAILRRHPDPQLAPSTHTRHRRTRKKVQKRTQLHTRATRHQISLILSRAKQRSR